MDIKKLLAFMSGGGKVLPFNSELDNFPSYIDRYFTCATQNKSSVPDTRRLGKDHERNAIKQIIKTQKTHGILK